MCGARANGQRFKPITARSTQRMVSAMKGASSGRASAFRLGVAGMGVSADVGVVDYSRMAPATRGQQRGTDALQGIGADRI
jgi:hypothetical protein